jgi:hypothetical protein
MQKKMNKLTFFLFTDILWYIIYISLSEYLIILFVRSLEIGSGEGGVGLIAALIFLYINSIFVLIQWLNSLFTLKKATYLIIKKYVFICHSIFSFSFYIYMCVIRLIDDLNNYNIDFLDIYYYPNSLMWLIYFVLFIVISNILYQVMISQLGKRLKW